MALAGTALAAPMWGELFPLEQPDGTPVEVRIWGDEFYRVVESPDGYTLVRDPDSGVICYARLSDDRYELLSTGVRFDTQPAAGLGLAKHLRIDPAEAQRQSQAVRDQAAAHDAAVMAELGLNKQRQSAPCTGDVQGICLIIDFNDEPATIPAQHVNDYCNQVGYSGYGNHGSVRDYFYDVSDGALTYTNFVPTAWFRASHLKSYYDDCDAPYGQRAREMVREALNYLNSQGFDFSEYDSNNDGLIDGINCFYAGYTSCGWAQGLWPHSGTMSWFAGGPISTITTAIRPGWAAFASCAPALLAPTPRNRAPT
jgi:hypothetical protein